MSAKISIPDFYAGRQIFITGGSGFMGKVLIEKLLRSCGDLDRIFVLLRAKKGKTAQKRLEEILQMPLFDLLRETKPTLLAKLVAINGDVTELRMGISLDDYSLMKNVSVIFHAAASVRFDEPLKDAIIINTRGTREVLRFAETLANLKVFAHVSTAYCNPDKHVIEEKLYPPYFDWKTAIAIAEKFDMEILDFLGQKLSSFHPNTYTFTKSMSEHTVNDYKDKLPVVVFRPCIVISTVNEPIPGWIDNFNGPIGLLLAGEVGIVRTVYANPNVASDFIPVDVAIKGLIIAAYEKGIETQKSTELAVYNCSTSNLRPVTTSQIVKLVKILFPLKPTERMLWVPYGSVTSSKTLHFIRFILLHLLPAVIFDSYLWLFNKRTFLLKIHRRIHAAILIFSYFISTQWDFRNEKLIDLDVRLAPCDVREFAFVYQKDWDIRDYSYKALVGAHKYLLKESDDNAVYARKKFWTIYYIDKILRYILGCYLVLVILNMFKLGMFVDHLLQ